MLSAQQQSRSTVALRALLHASRGASGCGRSVETFDKNKHVLRVSAKSLRGAQRKTALSPSVEN